MDRHRWIWLFIILMILNLLFAAITAVNIVEIESIYINIIRAPLMLLAIASLVLALIAKKQKRLNKYLIFFIYTVMRG